MTAFDVRIALRHVLRMLAFSTVSPARVDPVVALRGE